MNLYSYLPLTALFANLFLCFYLIYINPKNRLNQIYGLVTFSLAVWSLANFFMFSAPSTSQALFLNGFGTFGAVFTSIFLFQFAIFFCDMKRLKNKVFLIFLYLLGTILVFAEFGTNLFTQEMKVSYWGYVEVPGVLYSVLSVFVILFVVFSIVICYHFYKKTSSDKKNQAKYVIIAFLIPLIGGILSQVIALYIEFEIIPLTSTLTTFTALIIAFSVFRYDLLKPKSLSIKKKLVVTFFVLIFCLMFFTLTSVNIVAKDIMQDTVSNDLGAIAESRAAHVETFLFEQKRTVEDIACIAKIERFLLAERDSSEFYESLNLTVERLQETVDKDDDIVHISIIDTSGVILASTNSGAVGKNRSGDLLFLNGINYTYIGDLHLSCENSSLVFCVSTPLIDSNDNLTGVLLVRFKHDRLYEITTDTTGLGETGEVYIVNKSGFVLTPLRFYNLSYNYENIILKKKINTENFKKGMLHQNSTKGSVEEHNDVELFEDYRGERVLGAHVYIDEMQWVLLTEIDESEVFASVGDMQNTLTILLTISAIIILFIAYFYSKTISNPIEKLEILAKEIAKGNLNIDVDVKTSDEIGSLAKSFNEMAANLKEYNKELESQVEKRTRELQSKVEELEKFKKVTVGRELRMVELKKEIKRLESRHETGGKNFDA